MNKSIKRINANDFFRVLCTEVLPYEVPIWFSNFIFRSICNDNLIIKQGCDIRFFNTIVIPNLKGSSPYEYSITKNDDETRTVGIMHPYAQLKVVEFYKKYGDVIPYYCTTSPASLRFPWRVAKAVRSTDDAEEERRELADSPGRCPAEEEDVPCINFLDSYCSSYYVYRRVNFFYKFFESYDFHKKEKEFSKYVQVDVSKCFNSIYTHSLAWAIKGKKAAKEFKDALSFENKFDDLMQEINYRETHGILVGPEISRIFAEIILQRIDNDVIRSLKTKNVNYGVDYEYRRYVDDYVIFYNDEKTIEAVKCELKKNLAEYKMYLNESKTQYLNRPFISDISICKMELKNFITDFYKVKICDDKISYISDCGLYANRTIAKIKAIIKPYQGVTYKSISGFLLSEFKRKLSSFLKKAIVCDEKSLSLLLDNIIVDLDVIFFVLSMDIRVRTTDIVTRIVLEIIGNEHFSSEQAKGTLHKKIFDLCRNLFNILHASRMNRKIECCNLLLLLSSLDNKFEIQPDFIRKKIFPEENNAWSDYFVWISLMLYCCDKPKYSEIRKKLIEEWKKTFDSDFNMKETEKFLFFLDSMACPYLEDGDKVNIIEKLKKDKKIICKSNSNIRNFINKAKEKNFYVDWKNRNWLFEMSKRKMYIFPYE